MKKFSEEGDDEIFLIEQGPQYSIPQGMSSQNAHERTKQWPPNCDNIQIIHPQGTP